jgi:alpha-glucuronidase
MQVPAGSRNDGRDRRTESTFMASPFSPLGVPAPATSRGTFVVALSCLLTALLLRAAPIRAETGYDAWLRYARIDAKVAQEQYAKFPAVVVALGKSPVVESAREELIRGVRGMLGRTLRAASELPKESSILIGTFGDVQAAVPSIGKLPKLADDGFWLRSLDIGGSTCLVITAPNDRGVLYGVFALLRKIGLHEGVSGLNERQAPYAPLRVVNQWDDSDGSVARGYAGKSIFWEKGHIVKDLARVRDYARLLASVAINGATINRADSADRLLSKESLTEITRVADVLRPWGVKMYIALSSPSLSPPASRDRSRRRESEAATWEKKVGEVFSLIPDFGGFVLDGDLDGSPTAAPDSPTHVVATQALADALKPHGGILFYRCFVSDADIEAGDPKADPAKEVYDEIQPLDGKFADNVVVQIKNGPVDFQVREAPSPLFGALEKTSQAIEFQVTQEFLGQQRHAVFLVPAWKALLDFDMRAKSDATPIKALVAGKSFARPTGGMVAVVNVGRDANWLGHHLAMANLYGFGRLAWDPNLAPKAIAEEWTRLTFGSEPLVVGTIVDMLLKSWRMYENYTGPLGMGTLTDLAETHYGPAIEAVGPGAWRSWHSADERGVGKNRTRESGTGFTAQYREPVGKRFESLATCPDELLLFMHHVPYTHPLSSGKTVIQHIYDSHYAAARDASRLVDRWQLLKGRIDDERHQSVLKQLEYQAGHAQLWRDAVCTWFMHKSGIADNEGRVGNRPNRFEAEAMKREGFEPLNVTPWETASGGQCAQLVQPGNRGSIGVKYEGKDGWFTIGVRYFDENDGASTYRLSVNGQVVDEWNADDVLPDNRPNGHTSTRHDTPRLALRTGDEIRIEATADGGERAAIDFIEIEPAA